MKKWQEDINEVICSLEYVDLAVRQDDSLDSDKRRKIRQTITGVQETLNELIEEENS
jgi:hypothetical protein